MVGIRGGADGDAAVVEVDEPRADGVRQVGGIRPIRIDVCAGKVVAVNAGIVGARTHDALQLTPGGQAPTAVVAAAADGIGGGWQYGAGIGCLIASAT